MRWRRSRKAAEIPTDSNAAQRAALRAVLDGDLERATELLSSVVRRDSAAIEAYFALAQIFRAEGEVGRCIRIHQNLLLRRDLDPSQRVQALFGLGRDYAEGGFTQRAMAAFEEALVHEPAHAGALRALIPLCEQEGDAARALEGLRRLARVSDELDPQTEAEMTVRIARGAHERGEIDWARKTARRALRRAPECVAALVLLAEIEGERGKSRPALGHWRRAAELCPERIAGWEGALEASFAAAGRADEFLPWLRARHAEAPETPGLRVAIAATLERRGEVDEALTELRRRLDEAPGDARARVSLGRILLAEQRDVDALKEYDALLTQLEASDRGDGQ